MNRARSSIVFTGLGLILLANAIALGGVAYNRSGEPDSVLRLSERELRQPQVRENSGLSMNLNWRTLNENAGPESGMRIGYGGGPPRWLDQAKLIALGFDAQMHANLLLPREALLVLEYDGPAYQRALQRARQHAVDEEALHAAHPGNEEMARRARVAGEALAREEHASSRLFIVDAGLDRAQLRAAYPDRSRYAIVRGQVRAQWVKTGDAAPKLVGHIAGIHIDSINVPQAFHSRLAPARANGHEAGPNRPAPHEISVAFGRRLEPWIIGADDGGDVPMK